MNLLDPLASQLVGGSSILGVPMKPLSLIMLTFQNSALILVMHYSRMMPPDGDHRYFASTAVFLNEILKLAISLTFSIYETSRTLAPSTPATVMFEQIYNAVFSGDGWKLALPAALYTLQNYLQYVAVSNMDAVHFQILYQLKILTTAIFSVTLLRRPLGTTRWISLILLTIGVSTVSLPQAGSTLSDNHLLFHDFSDHYFPRSVHELGQIANGAGEVAQELTKRAMEDLSGLLMKRSATYEGIQEDQGVPANPVMSYSIGLSAVLVAAITSGFTGVYFEKVLKDSPTPVSVWTRNIQMSFYSIFPALFIGVWFKDGEEIAKHGFFDGYNWVVWVAIVFHAITGILTSLVINYADNIAKNFATSISILVSFVFSLWFFEYEVTLTFFIGTTIVLASVYIYSTPELPIARPTPMRLASFKEAKIDRVVSTPRTTDESRLNLNPMDGIKAVGMSTSRPSSPMLGHQRPSPSRVRNRED